MDAIVESVNHVPIRLSSERWMHIVEHHDDLAGHYHSVLECVGAPDAVYEGVGGELLAVARRFEPRRLVVTYRELSANDGFFTSRIGRLERRRLVWKRTSS